MARFGKPKARPLGDVDNLAGGRAFSVSDKLALASLALTSFVSDEYYRTSDEIVSYALAVAGRNDPLYVAKAALLARQHGLRSISHLLAASVADRAAGTEWGRRFFDKVVVRPDDMMEIVACRSHLMGSKGLHITHAMRKGFAAAFSRFDSYSLAKYRREKYDVSLVDIVNLVHPRPTPKNAEALQQLVGGTLREKGTWESEITRAAAEAGDDGETRDASKADVWRQLVLEGRLGQLVLLRNLRNIARLAPDVLDKACDQLVDGAGRGKVLPFQYVRAYRAIMNETGKMGQVDVQKICRALDGAATESARLLGGFMGSTLVALDVSGSMRGRPLEIASVFAAGLFLANEDADLMAFGSGAYFERTSKQVSLIALADSLSRKNYGGTNFHAIFNVAHRPYDRIVILSDMQAWAGGDFTPGEAVREYRRRTGANPAIFSFDVTGYGTLQWPEDRVFALAGISTHTTEIMRVLERDPQALIRAVETVPL